MKSRRLVVLVIGLILCILSTAAYAMPILEGSPSDGGFTTWTATDGEGRSALAVFEFNGSTLTITLSNTATSYGNNDKVNPNEVLAGFFLGGLLAFPCSPPCF